MLLKVKDIEKNYSNEIVSIKALDGINFFIEEGEFVGVMGPSGSGKSTLLNCISTLDCVSAGDIYLENEHINNIPEGKISEFRRNSLGFVFQDSNLLETLTMEENIALPLTIKEESPEEIHKKLLVVAKHLKIEDILSKFPYEVSGGQKQRGAIGRAIITEPKIIFADEPTGALDSKSSKNIMELFADTNKKRNSTILLVTHDPLAASYTNRILFLRDGRIFKEIFKGEKENVDFYHEILNILSELGGD